MKKFPTFNVGFHRIDEDSTTVVTNVCTICPDKEDDNILCLITESGKVVRVALDTCDKGSLQMWIDNDDDTVTELLNTSEPGEIKTVIFGD